MLIRFIYRYSELGSRHRQLAVDYFVHCMNRTGWRQSYCTVDSEFYKSVLDVIMRNLAEGMPRKAPVDVLVVPGEPCHFHDHGGVDGQCYKIRHPIQENHAEDC
ncbi:hypothetical protein M011DRAFT_470890, partial [Sporormia fimetaria CBS 119925]